jgi:trimeric autotransporter adhesin
MAGLALRRLPAALLICVLIVGIAGGAPAQQRVGVSSAVNPQASGTPPGGTTRQLVIGQDVVFNERITTSDAGQTQLLFLDESSMTVGPNSDLTIDQFVYDPKSGTGKLAMSATRGVLRFVGGKLSKQDQAVTLRTSTATLAVRGGAFIAKVEPSGKTDAIFIYGDGLTVTGANNLSETLRRPGFQITVSGPGAAPSSPSPVPPGQLAQLLQQLDGRSGGTGGATVIPTDTTVAQSGISQTVSGDVAGSVQQAVANQVQTSTINPLNPSNPVNVLSTTTGQTNTAAGQAIDCVITGGCSGQIIITPPQPPPPPVTKNYSGRLKDTNGQGTVRGFVDQGPNSNVTYTGTLSFPAGAPQSGVFTATAGNLGTFAFPLVPGSSSFTNGISSALGPFSGTTFLSANNADPSLNDTFFYATITPGSRPGDRLFIYGGIPVNSGFYAPTGSTRVFAFTVQPDAALQSNIPFIRSQTGGNLPNASVSPFYVVAPPNTQIGDTSTAAAARGTQTSLAINGQGANQQSVIAVTAGTIGMQGSQPVFNGQLRGSSMLSPTGTPVAIRSTVGSMVDTNGNSFYGGNTVSGFALDQAGSPAAEVSLSGTQNTYGFAQPVLPTATPAGVGSNRTTQTLTGGFGGLMYTTAQTRPYIVSGGTTVATDASTNQVQATFTGSAQSPAAGLSNVTMQYGGPTASQAFIDNSTFTALESQSSPQQVTVNGTPTQANGQLYLASSGAAGAPNSLLPAGVSYCQCQFLQWGYWGGDLSSGAGGPTPRVDSGHINTWVAGVPTPAADLASLAGVSASATYNGHAIGSVFNNGASYVAAGGFTGTYNFGTRNATLSVNNFDGRSFTASGIAAQNGANYSISSTSPIGQATMNGTFYGPAAAETGGNFAFQSATGLPSYLASGIYAGKKP